MKDCCVRTAEPFDRVYTNQVMREIYREMEERFEERRLFYVALTRTKKDIYLICPLNMSIFVKEIIRDSKNHIEWLDI